jgi:hypothetical protein
MKFKYTNYKGEIEERNVRPITLGWQGDPGFGYQPGLFLHAFDLERQAARTFSLGPDHFQPSDNPDMPWDDGGGLEIYRFPTDEQITLADIKATVTALANQLLEQAAPAPMQYCYRNKNEPNIAFVSGPVDELPYAVKTNRDAFDVWTLTRV